MKRPRELQRWPERGKGSWSRFQHLGADLSNRIRVDARTAGRSWILSGGSCGPRERRQRFRPALPSLAGPDESCLFSLTWSRPTNGGARGRKQNSPRACEIPSRRAASAPKAKGTCAHGRCSARQRDALKKRGPLVRREMTSDESSITRNRTDLRIWSLAFAELSLAEEGGLGKSARWRRKFATRRGSGGWARKPGARGSEVDRARPQLRWFRPALSAASSGNIRAPSAPNAIAPAQPLQNLECQGEPDCLIKTKHFEGRRRC